LTAVPLSRVIGPRKRPVLVAPPPRYRTRAGGVGGGGGAPGRGDPDRRAL